MAVRKTKKGLALKRWFKEKWKDVRTGKETGNVDAVMNGDIDAFLKSYLMMMGQKSES